jgi:hypothetical protein
LPDESEIVEPERPSYACPLYKTTGNPELKSKPQWFGKYQILAWFWAKRAVEKRRKRDVRTIRREDGKTGGREDGRTVGF